VERLLKAIEEDILVEVKRLLKSGNYNLNLEVEIGTEYDLDEYDEIPLLFYLIQKGISLEMLKLLIDNGMDIKMVNREGVGAIDYAIKYKRKDIVKLCKDYGIDLSQSRRKSGLTPLMLAASFSDIDMMEYLIENGASPNQRDRFGMSAFDYAAKLGQKRAVEFLEKLDELPREGE
jgi:ankyrin repeat protein